MKRYHYSILPNSIYTSLDEIRVNDLVIFLNDGFKIINTSVVGNFVHYVLEKEVKSNAGKRGKN